MRRHSTFPVRLRSALLVIAWAILLPGVGFATPGDPDWDGGTSGPPPGPPPPAGSPPLPTPSQPEPKEYSGGGGSGNAIGTPYQDYYSLADCWPLQPSGQMSINAGAGEIKLDGKPVGSLVIGDGASKTPFEWKPVLALSDPAKKSTLPTTAWACCGAAEFQRGFSYGVSVSSQGKIAPCGAETVVSRPGTVNAPVVVWSGESSATAYFPKIQTRTTATAKSNPNWWRKKVGVGEEVTCRLEGAPEGGSVSWTTSGTGCAITGSGYSATFVAGDENTSAVITAELVAVINDQVVTVTDTVALTVVEPTGVTGTKVFEGSAGYPKNDLPPAGSRAVIAVAFMRVLWHFAPDVVSFINVQKRELGCPATNTKGCYRINAGSHSANNWTNLRENNDDVDADEVGNTRGPRSSPPPKWFGFNPTPPQFYEPGGDFDWVIPWEWQVAAKGNAKAGGTNIHHTTVSEDGVMTVAKLGQTTTGLPIGPL